MSIKITCTTAEAIKELNKRRGLKHIKYGVYVRPFLPTSDNRGFPGLCIASVTKSVFIKALKDCLCNFEERGGKIELTVPTEDFESFLIG